MTISVKATLLAAAQALGIAEEVRKFLDGEDTVSGEKNFSLLLTCFNRVENELALDYLPLMAEDELVTATGVVEYSALSENAVRIFCVEDEQGNSLKFKLFPRCLKTKVGRVKIVYAYTPTEKTVEEESEFTTGVSERLFVYGIAAEYSLAVGDLNAANVWDKKFREGARAAYRLRPCKKISSRRWI